MASASTFLSHPNPHTNDAVFSSRNHFHSFRHFASQSNSKFKSKPISFSASATRSEPARSSVSEPISASQTFNVLIIGAGIIGLTIARQFLIGSDMSVTVIDKAVPCSSATGTGKSPTVGEIPVTGVRRGNSGDRIPVGKFGDRIPAAGDRSSSWHLLQLASFATVNHVRHEANKVAHSLAKNAKVALHSVSTCFVPSRDRVARRSEVEFLGLSHGTCTSDSFTGSGLGWPSLRLSDT
ncbi:hypothetical protein ACLB2K_026693 [Fragaria x ananassa]